MKRLRGVVGRHQTGTPFSGFRWIIPEVCGFQGRAIYTDCDMINFKDMNELINIDMEGKPVAARRGNRFGGHEFCVMVFDCAAFEHYSMPSRRMKMIPESHHRMINKFSGSTLVKDLDPKWNCLDGEYLDLEDIWQLHYTNMATQPWRPEWYVGPQEEHKRKDVVDVWYSMYEEAKAFGMDEQNYIPEESFGEYDIIGQ